MQISENELKKKYIPLVRKIVARIFCRLPDKIEFNELFSAGILGLIDAATKFEASKGEDFQAYAEFRIKGAILDDLRSRDFIPRQQRKKYKEIEQEKIKIESEMGKKITLEDLSSYIKIPVDELEKIYLTVEASVHSELNDDIYYTNGDQNIDMMEIFDTNQIQSPFKKMFYKEMKQNLVEAIKILPERNQLILSLYYEQELNFKEIGLVLDLTEARVSQLHKQSIKLLQDKLNI